MGPESVVIGLIIGALAGAHRTENDDPTWRQASNTLGGGVLGALGGYYLQSGQLAVEGGMSATEGGAAAGSSAQTTAGIGFGGAGGGAAIAGGAGAGAGTGTIAPAAIQSADAVKPVLAEGMQGAQLVPEGTNLASASQGYGGNLAQQAEAGLSAPNTTGMDPNGIFSNVPQYMRYRSPLEQLNYKFKQFGLDKINTEDVIALMGSMQGGDGQQQQPQQQPRQYNQEALIQNAEMYQDIDFDSEMLNSRLAMDSGTMSGAFSPSLFDQPGEDDFDEGFGQGFGRGFGTQNNRQSMYASLFNDQPDDSYGWYV